MNIWILSQQQRKVLQLSACGFNGKQIAVYLGLSSTAVRSSANQIYKKLDARCRIDAIYAAIQLGEISELAAYHYVEARQMANYLADNKQSDIRLPRPNRDFLIASNNGTPVHYSRNPPFLSK